MAQRSALINVMSAAAGKAGRVLVRAFGEIEGLQVSKKGPADFVSEADHRSEKILFEELSKARPNYGFVMKEGGSIAGSDISNAWIVDPLDGTLNFLHGLPHFAISIALKRDSKLFAGLIYAPASDDLFWAEKGKGAFLNGHRLRVSSRFPYNPIGPVRHHGGARMLPSLRNRATVCSRPPILPPLTATRGVTCSWD